MRKFEVVFSGQTAPGMDSGQVRQGVQRLFNASEQVLERFFSGRRVVIKRDLDEATARKYEQALQRVGALAEVVPMQTVPVTAAAEPPPAAAEPVSQQIPEETQAAASPADDFVPRDEFMAAFAHVQAPDFGLAAVGADLLETRPQVDVPEIDTSALSLAPAGSDLEQLPGADPLPMPDISHLSLAEETE